MTHISDPQKETIFVIDLSGNRCQITVRKVISCDTIIALEKRLQAAERLATACAVEHGQHDFEPECGVCYALAAYRKGSHNE